MKTLRALLLTVAVSALLLVGGCMALPSLLCALNPEVIYRVPDAGHTLYLTLDDGPSAATPQILDVLRRHDVKATFFITADHIQPELMRRISTEGHQIANHLKTTTSIDRLSTEVFEADFVAADKALSGFGAVKLFRPPGGSITDQQVAYVRDHGYKVVLGTIYPLDHWLSNATTIELIASVLVTDGGIVILHDTQTRGARSAAVLDKLIPNLKRRGYRFALLPEA